MPVKELLVKVLECTCKECAHYWITETEQLPKNCPKCKTEDWNTAWKVEEISSKEIKPLSDDQKKRLESQMINQSRILQAERRGRRRVEADPNK
jgi:predicted  nucleic acid-binding Zn-ribbon protein